MTKKEMGVETVTWALRLAVAGEFLGHGMFALGGKADWIKWVNQLAGLDLNTSAQFIMLIGLIDIALAALVLIKPVRLALLWMAFWGFWTALVRPLVGLPVWDFVERWANWGAPLALLLLVGWPKKTEEWFN